MSEAGNREQRGTGKWARPGVPHKGWRWVGSEDLGRDRRTCEMCEAAEIRYVHYARHPHHPEVLAVGCVCIEHMTDDPVGPRAQEKRLRQDARRRRTFPDRKRWTLSRRGNPTIEVDGYRVVLTRTGRDWRVLIKPPAGDAFIPGRKRFDSERDARLAAFDGVMYLKSKAGAGRHRTP